MNTKQTPFRHLLLFLAGLATVALALAQTPAPAPNLGATALKSPPLAKKIVLIGGKKSHGPGEHDFPNGIPLIAAWLKASPAFAAVDVVAMTGGWPTNLSTLDGASTIVCYFDGVQETPEPLNNPERVAYLQKLMDAGTGLVGLHQVCTVPQANHTIPLSNWLGARRDGMFDRTTEQVTLKPFTPEHPVSAGMGELTYTDEFYPTLIFSTEGKVTPILRGEVTPKFGDAKKQAATPAQKGVFTLAWAYERPAGGGRAFGFTGAHYLKPLNEPALRQMIVNAIAWTARIDVPKTGIAIPEPIVSVSSVMKKADNKVTEMPWGQLRWFTSAELKNSRTMTTGVAIIKPGQSNPRHFHPNCDEILHVISGKISHTMNEVTVEMNAGDTVSIPQGVLHNARNIGTEDAVLTISFNSAYREAVGY
ncbi:MAG: cupin domain-containing protein [Verrucomicrobiales bacterium]|nr:cupin domain-containing protein [Verrucomicrobiales bacterium]